MTWAGRRAGISLWRSIVHGCGKIKERELEGEAGDPPKNQNLGYRGSLGRTFSD
jgi:hypothetical protein